MSGNVVGNGLFDPGPAIFDFRDDLEGSDCRWVLRWYDLADLLHQERDGFRMNTWAERMVKDFLIVVDSDLYDRIEHDSEMGCYFAYCKTREDAEALVAHIEFLVESVNDPAGGVF